MASVNNLGLFDPTSFGKTPAATEKDTKSRTDLGVGKDEFLKLLVAQLQNQDPLNPLQNEQFVSQLATFSSLEQLIEINKAVTLLADSAESAQVGEGNNKDIAGTL